MSEELMPVAKWEIYALPWAIDGVEGVEFVHLCWLTQDGSPVVCGKIEMVFRFEELEVALARLFVREELRRQGIASELVLACANEVRRVDPRYSTMNLSVNARNTEAITAYGTMGFIFDDEEAARRKLHLSQRMMVAEIKDVIELLERGC